MGAQESARFNASAHFAFVTQIGNDLDMEMLWRALELADQAAPWVERYASGHLTPSINWHGSMTMREGDWIDRRYEQEIRPFGLLSYSQLMAYERYANNLAREVTQLCLPGVIAVHVAVHFIGTCTTYRPNK